MTVVTEKRKFNQNFKMIKQWDFPLLDSRLQYIFEELYSHFKCKRIL